MRDIMTFLCRRKLKVVVYFVVATFLFVDITQKFSPSYQVQECVPKASLSLATGVVKPAVNPAGESQSLDHVIYPEVTVVPRIVYYLWCDNKTFEFKHYLSVLSVVRFVRPERIVFEYGARPPIDRYMYNTWLAELMDTLSYLELQEMTSRRHADVCRDERSRRAYIVTKIRRDGGIFVGKNTIFTRELRGLTETSTTKLLSSYEGYFMSKSQNLDAEKDSWPSLCLRASDYESRKPNASDITTHVCEYRTIYPRDIMSGGDAFASLARSLFYGDSAAPTPHSDSQRLIPNIAHMLWIGGTRIDFLFYLSALSLLYVVNVERLFIHGDLPPSGHYWRRLEGQARITYVPCAKPNVAFGHISGSKHHMSDIFRAQVMIKYGGIYSDVDVIWTRAPSVEMRSYEAVASFDWANAYSPYPNYINLGVSLGQRGSRFWRLFRDSLKTFRDDIFGFNGLLQPYKVYERHPDTIRMDDHLQVMCFRKRCYPRWGVAFESIDWRHEAHAVHWTWPTPAEFKNQETLVNATGTWAEIGQNVLRHAGLLDEKAGRGG